MEFIYSNAGHPPALLFRKGVREPEVLDTDTGFAFGITPECVYQEKTVKLQSYDKIFLYTDGIVEARNPDSRIYGVESFNKTVADNFDKPIEQILDALMKDVAKFADGAVFLDDINILAMEVL
jgi:serine phosphatase RsbU (regulator of sigma subunit)